MAEKPVELVKHEEQVERERQIKMTEKELESQIIYFLQENNSPLADVVPYLLTKKHWKLAIAVSAIESRYCTRQLYLNCWGIGGDSAYRHYPDLETGIDDFDALISRWQAKKKWLTPEQMNCSYVVPCNRAWVRTVNSVLTDLNDLESRTKGSAARNDTRASTHH